MSSPKNDPELMKKLIDDDEELQTPLVVTAAPSPRSRSGGCPCWCKCLLITLAVLFTLTTLFFVGTYMLIKDGVEHLTVTTPHDPYPVVDMTDAELEVVKDRVTLFVDQLVAKTPDMEPLEITENEIMGFISHSDYLRGNYLVTLEDGIIKEEYSLPTWMFPGGSGRYFVGSDYLKVKDGQLETEWETAAKHHDWFDGPLLFAQFQYLVKKHDDKDQLELYLEKGSFLGHEAPADYIAKRENLLEELYEDADCEHARAVLERIEGVAIKQGKIVITPRKDFN